MDHYIHLSMFFLYTYIVANSPEATRHHVHVSLLEHKCGDKKSHCDISMSLQKGKALTCPGSYSCCRNCDASAVINLATSNQEDTVLVQISVCRHSDYLSDPSPYQMCHVIHLNPTRNDSTELNTDITTTARIQWSVYPYTDNAIPTSTVVPGFNISSTHLDTVVVTNAPKSSVGTTSSSGNSRYLMCSLQLLHCYTLINFFYGI